MPGETQIILPAVEVAERSDPGRDPTKRINEDACAHRETRFGVLAVVCDGMGGHVGGREASTAALATILEAFEKAPPRTPPREVLRDAIRLANVRVRGLVLSDPGGGRPGSTVVAVLVHPGGTEVAHVGDSRVYLVQQGQIFQLTRDHSMVQEMVEAKILTLDQAAAHPDANKITRALGIDDDVDVEVRLQPIAHRAGDAFILCSDGLSDLVEPADMLAIVSSDPPAQAAGKLVDLANARGGYDNITVVLVKPRASAPSAAPGPIAATLIESTLTLRPPAAAPFAVVPGDPPVVTAPPFVRARSRIPTVLGVAGGCVVTLGALVWLRLGVHDRVGHKSALPAIDAAPVVVSLGAPPTASLNLAPVALPEPTQIDAAGVAPLEPVPGPRVRHLHGKH